MNMMITEQQLSEDEGDANLAIAREAKTTLTLTSVSTGSSNWSGTASAADSSAHNDALTPHGHPDPPEDNVPDDVATTPQDDDHVKLCEEGCSSPSSALIDDYDDNNDSDSNDNSELQSLCRQPSIITRPSQSDERCLPEDTFSFLIYSHVRSRAFLLATFVFAFQIAIYAVLAGDIINVMNRRNPLKLPVNVHQSVRAAEFLAIVVAIITQDDVRKAVNLIRDGFDDDIVKAFEGATKAKWILSIVLRGSEGLLGLFLTFLLIMQSSTVLDLLLNFLAMEFVSQLDDVVFILTRERFFGRVLKKEAMKVSNTFYRLSHFSTESKATSFITAAYFIILFTAMFAGWGIIFRNQAEGQYLCPYIFAQYGDESLPLLSTFTGLYYLHNEPFGSYREGGKDGGALLSNCAKEARWTLSLPNVTLTKNGDTLYDYNPCNWTAASEFSADFDVLTTANSQWIARNSKRVLPLSQHYMACYDCSIDDNFCGEHGFCYNTYGVCVCNDDRHGVRCEYTEPCPMLEIKQNDEGFVKTGGPNQLVLLPSIIGWKV